ERVHAVHVVRIDRYHIPCDGVGADRQWALQRNDELLLVLRVVRQLSNGDLLSGLIFQFHAREFYNHSLAKTQPDFGWGGSHTLARRSGRLEGRMGLR